MPADDYICTSKLHNRCNTIYLCAFSVCHQKVKTKLKRAHETGSKHRENLRRSNALKRPAESVEVEEETIASKKGRNSSEFFYPSFQSAPIQIQWDFMALQPGLQKNPRMTRDRLLRCQITSLTALLKQKR